MKLASSRIWTRVAVSISYDDNHYTTGTSKVNVIARLQYELAYYDSTVYRFSRYTTRTAPVIHLFQTVQVLEPWWVVE